MSLAPAFALCFLLATIGGPRVAGRSFVVRNAEKIFWTGALGVATALVVMSHLQFEAWANGGFVAQHLVPPLGGHRYFLFYIWWRFWAPYAISFVVAPIFFRLARWYNQRHSEQFFYEEEYYFIALGIFLTGQPGWIFYLLAMVLVAICAHIGIAASRFAGLVTTDCRRFSLYDFWLPVAAFVILSMTWIAQLPWFGVLKP